MWVEHILPFFLHFVFWLQTGFRLKMVSLFLFIQSITNCEWKIWLFRSLLAFWQKSSTCLTILTTNKKRVPCWKTGTWRSQLHNIQKTTGMFLFVIHWINVVFTISVCIKHTLHPPMSLLKHPLKIKDNGVGKCFCCNASTHKNAQCHFIKVLWHLKSFRLIWKLIPQLTALHSFQTIR